jgi:hypothetical protein
VLFQQFLRFFENFSLFTTADTNESKPKELDQIICLIEGLNTMLRSALRRKVPMLIKKTSLFSNALFHFNGIVAFTA